jgi:uncharacterized protein (TIGR00255 family)
MSIKSMTGYGKGEAARDELIVTAEIKTVNHRYADVNVKLPRTFLAHEGGLRKQVSKALGRGKIDVYVNYELASATQVAPVLDAGLARSYHQLFARLAEELDLDGRVTIDHLINQKDVIRIEEASIDEALFAACLAEAVDKALDQLIGMRLAEGAEMLKDFKERLQSGEKLLARIEARAPQVPAEWQEKLTERLTRLQQNVEWDPQRVAQEIAVFTDRCDISEEITRFKSHLVQFRGLFDADEPVGRRMDFLVQELNREINTMGSKSNDAELTGAVVALKAELEKIREQVQNVE